MTALNKDNIQTIDRDSISSDRISSIYKETVPDRNIDPDEKKEYVVSVKRGMTIDQLQDALVRDTSSDDTIDSRVIPDREIEIADRREGSERQTHFLLTTDEANNLRNHPDVASVSLCLDHNPHLKKRLAGRFTGNFDKGSLFGTSAGSLGNYGLYRSSNSTNVYGTGTSANPANYDYVLDGSGVDVIIMDDGVHPSHPEWEDAQGNSRFQQIDWYQAAGISGNMPENYYTEPSSAHGTHVAGIVAGKTFGWAKNARIYSMNILGTAGMTIPTETAFDLMKLFHRNKPVDPNTGFKRPTIVNASWGVLTYYVSMPPPYDPYQGMTLYVDQLWQGSYRGIPWSGYQADINKGIGGTNVLDVVISGITGGYYRTSGHSPTYDQLVEDLIDEGIIFVHSPGNEGVKSERSSGVDYNNYIQLFASLTPQGQPVLTDPIYYNRPSSPTSEECIEVGSVDVSPYSATLEKRAWYSHYGTGVDLYATGTGIISASVSGTGSSYYFDNNYTQTNESGTSMSAPQASGLLALFMQINPGATPAMAKKWLLEKGSVENVLYNDSSTNNYYSSYGGSQYSLSGGNNKFLFNPYYLERETIYKTGGKTTNGVFILKK